MGVYIKGVEMPKNSSVQILTIFDDGIVISKYGDRQYKAVEVKEPHGRLIEVTSKLRQELCWYEAYTGIDEAPVKYANSVIDDAPTVIESEGE